MRRAFYIVGVGLFLIAERSFAQDTPPLPDPTVVRPAPTATPREDAAEHRPVPLTWDPGWARFGAANYVVTGVGIAVAIGAAIVSPQPRHVTGGILFDNAVQDTLKIDVHNIGARYFARDTSDVLLSLTTTAPFFLDAMATAWYTRQSPEVALQMALIDAEAFAIAGALQETMTALVSRERPYGSECGVPGQLPSNTLDCVNSGLYRSFFSGHSVLSFTAAGLTCQHHLTLRLIGDGPGDALVCAGSLVLAGATATLRVVSDQHWATDVVAGSLIGTAIGLGIPALHYRGGHKKDARSGAGLDLTLVPTGAGASVVGTFR